MTRRFPPFATSSRRSMLLRLGLYLLLAAATWAQPPALREYQIKAVFLFNFARFVEWPAGAFPDEHSPVVLGVLGDDPFGSYLDDAVQNETANGRPIVVRRFRRVDDVTGCHILFISRSEEAPLQTILARLKGQNILTVSDTNNFAERGGMIGFVTAESKVRLQINVAAARQAALTMSAKLLRPSEIIGPKPGANGFYWWRSNLILLAEAPNGSVVPPHPS